MKNLKAKKIIFAFAFLSLMLVIGISVANAYYTNTSSISVLASLVGDFDSGDGDINMIYYKENDEGRYVRTYAIPALGYTFNDAKTNCNQTCSNSDSSASCYYNYDSTTHSINLDSEDKVTCKFYFDKEINADVIVNILKQDENGTYEYNSNKYSLSENVPAFGYDYVGYSCTNGSTAQYISDTRTFKVNTTQKDTCYVYFDTNEEVADIVTKIYIKENTEYKEVEYIPQNKTYTLSQTEASYCVNGITDNASYSNANSSTISYENGYINIDSSEQQTCKVYLDLVTE